MKISRKTSTKKMVEKANQAYHTKLATDYDKTQPHFRPENQERVRRLITEYAKITGGNRLLDLGCGTGFILSIAKPYFKELVGVDLTQAMLDLAKEKYGSKDSGKIRLVLASTDTMPFENNYFDVATGYSFLHHLPSLLPTLRESHRVLKKGGIIYTDLDPNFYFWKAMKDCLNAKDLSEPMKIEVKSIRDMVGDVRSVEKSLDRKTIINAEYVEGFKGGFKEDQVIESFNKAGFSKIKLTYHWFWQEGRVIKDLSPNAAEYFENHLRLSLPASRVFFKYFRVEATK